MAITRAKKKPESPAPAIRPKARASHSGEHAEARAEKFIAEAGPSATAATALAIRSSGPAPESVTTVWSSRESKAQELVKSYLPLAAGAGLVPIPAVDLALIIAVQLRMLAKLAELYSVPFRQEAAKSCAASLMAILLQGTLAAGLISTFKFVPVIGALVGIAAMPALGAAGTYAVGKVFITHFEAGGTFLDFDPKKVETHFRTEFERARNKSV